MDQCFAITKEQINLLSEAIVKRKERELEFDASIHGAKLKKTSSDTRKLKTSEDFDRLKKEGLTH